MAITADDLKAHMNMTEPLDEIDAVVLPRVLGAAKAHIERLLGFKLTDTEELPDGPPADLELAVLMLAADWYENREASLIGITGRPVPFGVQDIVAEYRRYTFGVSNDG